MSAFWENLILERVERQSAGLSEQRRKPPKIHIDIVKEKQKRQKAQRQMPKTKE
jgi:hypothetical protein